MNHPTREQWLAHLYADEAEPGIAAELQQHLADCPECQARVDAWRATAQSLDAWRIAPVPAEPLRRTAAFRRWTAAAAAAVAILAVGILAGRQTAASREEVAALREELVRLSSGIDARMQQVAAAETAAQLKPVALALRDGLQEVRTEQSAQYLSLRKELETVAVFTAAGFRQTESSLVQLANHTPPASSASPLQ